ncbi:hypothetical protein N7492_000829 [Penicillium capsulatum]|uniref:XRCC4 coiled-coil domain-containing protein n=1 Tax=Penicillium capsulatum TaxID=69766 RepID=A0A9W9IS23_9EURO|nr:hypothetical protein N7492_000829 [Penicillium capsulatum]
MASPRILRLARSDEPHGFILLRVSQTGPAPLDLSLIATEGESPYTGVVRQSQLSKLRLKNYQGTDEEWTRIVSLVFGQHTSPDEPIGLPEIEVSTSITGSGDEGREVVITIRKRVQDITQRLGSIALQQDDEREIELFEWSSIAAARVDALETQLTSVTDRCRVAEDTIHKLSEQLNHLLQAKDQHENQLLSHFVQLLNEKKLKIRNQQRLLASATVNPAKVAEIQAIAQQVQDPGDIQDSTKRHAQAMGGIDEDTDEDLERMDVDQTKPDSLSKSGMTDDEGPSTPQPLEEGETTTDDEGNSSTGAEESTKESFEHPPGCGNSPAPKEKLPPRRELPFTKRAPSNATKSEPTGDETAGETDDDEL